MVLAGISLIFVITILPVSDAYQNGKRLLSSGRVVGGDFTSQRFFPFLVSIQKTSRNKTGWSHSCGGSIVSKSWVLTACHCVASTKSQPLKYKDLSQMRIVGGVTDLKSKSPSRQERGIKAAVAHEKCRRGGRIRPYTYYDVGLLKLDFPLELNDRVQPLALVSLDKTAAVEELRRLQEMHFDCYSPGWGRVGQVPKVVRSSILKVAIQTLHTATECHRILCYINHVRDHEGKCSNLDRIEQVCVTSNNSSVCNGDSGGPLVCNGFVFGTVSQVGSTCKYGGMQIFSGVKSIINLVNKYVREDD